MELKYLLAVLSLVVSPPPGTADPSFAIDFAFPEFVSTPGESRTGWIRLETTQPQSGSGDVTFAISVNDVSTEPLKSRVTVRVAPEPKLIPVGAKVKAPGQTKVKVRVGVKNVSAEPIPLRAPSQFDPDGYDSYIKLPGDVFAESATGGVCIPWGPWPEGWGWLYPGESSYQYLCGGVHPLEPGKTHLYELVVLMSPQKPLVTGEISLHDETKAAIVIDTRMPATLPVTGMRIVDIAIAAVALIVPGVALAFMFAREYRRPRRRRRDP